MTTTYRVGSHGAVHNDAHERLARLAAAQHGVFHLDQATELGVDRRRLRYAEARGGLHLVHPRVWRIPGSPETTKQAVWGAVLQVGAGHLDGDVAASHESCFGARGITHVPFELAVSTGTDGNQHHDGIRVHRFCDLRPGMIEMVDGLPVTSVARGVVDVASVFRRDRMDQLIDRVTITEGITTLGAIDRALRRSNRRGRRNIRVLQELLDRRGDEVPRSVAERLADELLATTDLPRPIAEYPHPGWDLGPAFVDRAWPEVMLIVEIDGRSWHSRERDMARDRQRDRAAGRSGWHTARFLARELRDEPQAFVADVVALHERRRTQLLA